MLRLKQNFGLVDDQVKITCIECDQDFTITAAQLGTRGKCPHCKTTIILPRAESLAETRELHRPRPWLELSLSSVGSVMLHLMVLVVLLLIPWGGSKHGDHGEGDVVQLGVLDDFELTMTEQQSLDFTDVVQDQNSQSEFRQFESIQFPLTMDPFSDQTADFENILKTGGTDETAELSNSVPKSVSAIGSEDFGELVTRLQRDGLDIVITFDSTGSMDEYIHQVKTKIERMGNVLFRMIPKTRISVCTYRDHNEKYIVEGLPLTSNLTEVIEYLETIEAGGGKDIPEAVDAGLGWSIHQNSFRPNARKIILLFGDAPPHQANYNRCLRLAAEFKDELGGIVSTVTCHGERRLPAFVEISKLGGGEAFLTQNEREIMSQLIVLVFGSKHREKVVEAFDLLRR